jgi:hypothetical protein
MLLLMQLAWRFPLLLLLLLTQPVCASRHLHTPLLRLWLLQPHHLPPLHEHLLPQLPARPVSPEHGMKRLIAPGFGWALKTHQQGTYPAGKMLEIPRSHVTPQGCKHTQQRQQDCHLLPLPLPLLRGG